MRVRRLPFPGGDLGFEALSSADPAVEAFAEED
jgi:hypothetical protein